MAMVLAKNKMRTLFLTLVLITGCIWYTFTRHNESVAPSAEHEVQACQGAEEKPVSRTEDYIQDLYSKLAQEAREFDRNENQEALDIAFYGDSIAETWRGTDMGRECARCAGGREIFERFFQTRYNAHIFAVGGDQVAHLQWRLLNGELMMHRPPKVTVLMIGTNDFGAAVPCFQKKVPLAVQGVNALFGRIQSVVQFLRIHTPTSKIILVGLPQRAVWSNDLRRFEYPNIFTAPIDAANHILRKLGSENDFVHYVACGEALLQNGEFDLRMQPDGLHLSPEGSEVIAACILRVVEGILGRGDLNRASTSSGVDLTHWVNAAKETRKFIG